MKKNILVLIICLLALFISAQKPFTALENQKVSRVGSPVVSPNGKFAVYTVRNWNPENRETTTNLDILDLTTSTSKRLTYEKGKSDYSPVWFDDTHVVFLSSRGRGVWLVNIDSGEVRNVGQLPVDIADIKFSPTGSYVLFTAEVYVDCPTLQCTADRDAKLGPGTPRIYNKLMIRHWDHWKTEGKVKHIFLLRLPSKDYNTWFNSGNEPIDLLKGMNVDAPMEPFGGAEQFDISPDGKLIAFSGETQNEKTAWTTGWDTYLVRVTETTISPPELLTGYTSGRTQNPSFSPNGRYLSYLAMDRAGYEADRLKVVLYDLQTNQRKVIAPHWDRSIGSLVWHHESRYLFVTADEDGRHKLFALDTMTSSVEVLLADATNHDITLIPNSNRVLFTRNSYKAPNDIWSFEFQNGKATQIKQITNYNDHLKDFYMADPIHFTFPGANNEKVQAWVFQPIGFDAGKKYPVVQLIHGGPQSAWTDGWSYRWHPQIWASHGYGVIAINFHGSTGFGQNFTDSINGDWGGKPFIDIMKGMEAALSTFKWMDGNRVGAAGASYGGFMINWLNGHTDRFKALVTHCGVFDSIAMYFTTEELFFNEWEFRGTPWQNPTLYDKFNPRAHVHKWKTPTLVIHGSMDFRVPISEGLGVFTALQRRSIPSKFVHFPTENHWVLDSHNSIQWYREVLEWLDKYLK